MNQALLITGGEYHPFETCGRILADALAARQAAECRVTTDRDALLQLGDVDVVIAYVQGGALTDAQEKSLCDWVESGGAFIGIHCASDAWVDNGRYMEMIGTQFAGHGPVTEILVNVKDDRHDTTIRTDAFRVIDEFYILQRRTDAELHEVLTAGWKFESHPMAYTRDYGQGRVFYTALGHDERAFGHPAFQKLIHRAIIWGTGGGKPGPVRMGVIGYGGLFAMAKCHADAIRTTPGLKLEAICDIDAARLEAAAQEQPGAELYDDMSKLIASGTIDHATVVTPHNTHAPLVIELLEAGIPAACEKPFATTIADATAMIDTARRTGVSLAGFHNRRWDPDYLTIRKIIDEGLLGEVFHIETFMGGYGHPGTWWRSDQPVSGGALFDWGAHFIDWILNLMPHRVESVMGFARKDMWHDITNEDHARAIIRFEGGRTAEFEVSSLAAATKNKWRILGTLGGLTNNWDEPLKVTTYAHGLRQEMSVPLVESRWVIDYYRELADYLLLGEPMPVTPESARRVVAVLELAGRSSLTGRPESFPAELYDDLG